MKPSWTSLRFAPDEFTASLLYGEAAQKFRAAKLLPDAVGAWVLSAQLKEKLNDYTGAARAFESAAAICDGNERAGGPMAAVVYWEKAVFNFRLCSKHEPAAKLLLKAAAVHEKQGDVDRTKAAFEDAIEVFREEERALHNLADVYKQFISFLVRHSLFEDAVKAIDGHTEVLVQQKHFTFAHKELLSKTVLFLHLQDTIGAQDALNPRQDVEGWFRSTECHVGMEMVAAFQQNDDEALEALTKETVLAFLQVEVARIAKTLKITASPYVPAMGAAVLSAPLPAQSLVSEVAPPLPPAPPVDAAALGVGVASSTQDGKDEPIAAAAAAAATDSSANDVAAEIARAVTPVEPSANSVEALADSLM